MKHFFTLLLMAIGAAAHSQTPSTFTSSEILLQLKKMKVLGSVLYVAAHPDDENTRLLAYLANEKMYRTGYLSLTRGDGGQNLIGDEQGVDLGLIRTQELLAARRVDGAEQFFTTAYDFGFSKSPEEALRFWNHDKVLADVVWVVRQFRPDVIIARFPEDSRAGHGHHSASGILAREAFDAAADPSRFPEQLTKGVTVWQAKRMLWNTFNFGGGTDTRNESQFKVEVGMYNALLGRSYGEIAAISRSQHKSQGFGVPAQRGGMMEYFETLRGDKPQSDLLDGVITNWQREQQSNINDTLEQIIQHYQVQYPEASLPSLIRLHNHMNTIPNGYWKTQKLKELKQVIASASGLFLEAIATDEYLVQGDSVKITILANNRQGIDAGNLKVRFFSAGETIAALPKNQTISKTKSLLLAKDEPLTQPYWLMNRMEKGSFNVTNQQWIGMAENEPLSAQFELDISGERISFVKPIRYKHTDPVKGEIYQPVYVVPPFTIKIEPEVLLPFSSGIKIAAYPNKDLANVNIDAVVNGIKKPILLTRLSKGIVAKSEVPVKAIQAEKNEKDDDAASNNGADIQFYTGQQEWLQEQKNITYDHIPHQTYFKKPQLNRVSFSLKVTGKHIGYILGAGDKVPQALEQMGYVVTLLKEADITPDNLEQFDAVVTGIRAYNTNDWMGNVYATLMDFVSKGGVLVTQYNTNNFISSIRGKIGPFPFGVSRNRITDETADVTFLQPQHPVLNFPNKITPTDFEGWIQERSIYHAEKADSSYQRILSMKDPGETAAQDGSLVVANYGKGRFVYTGLVFFRQLPAGVPGAYRLLANLVARPLQPAAGKEQPAAKKASLKNSKLAN
jgi:LmbE family N-acetylglucosaminyl deacetylase